MNKISGGNVLINPQTIIEKAEIGDRMRVADLGCGGSGHFIFPIAAVVGEQGIIYGVDILKNNLANIERRAKQENLPQVQVVWTNLEIFKATKINSSSLDVALLINVLYLSNKRTEMIREAIRMIKKNGKLIIADWKQNHSPFGPSINERVNKDNLIAVCQRMGMELLEEFNLGEYHFGLSFLKH